jgi:excisionase family DNA binding protein
LFKLGFNAATFRGRSRSAMAGGGHSHPMPEITIHQEDLEDRRRSPGFEDALLLLSSLPRPTGNPPDSHPKAEFINTKAAAAWLGIPLRSLHQYVQTGLLPSYKLGRHRLFRRSELLDALGASRMATRADILR